MSTRTDQMQEIQDAVVDLRTDLADQRRKGGWLPVIGEGSRTAQIIFIGEAPGKNEAEQGRPFCGASGRVLDDLLGSIGLKREKVYVTNVLKDRPPNNRDPSADDIAAYAPFLERQIEIIKPSVVATLGRFAMEWVMRYYDIVAPVPSISTIHASNYPFKIADNDVVLIPLFHPAVALYNANQKKTLLEDFQVLKKFL